MDHAEFRDGLVYVVDDDPVIRRTVAALLDTAELPCQCFDSGQGFLDAYADEAAACLIVDIRMPGLSGIQLIERCRERGIDHPVLVMTGYGDAATVAEAFRRGVVDFFEKPFAGSVLLDRVQRALEADRQARARHAAVRGVEDRLGRLSKREHEVLAELIRGTPNKQIAWKLDLSDKTIAAHRANLLKKMEIESLPQLVATVVAAGLYVVDLGDGGRAAQTGPRPAPRLRHVSANPPLPRPVSFPMIRSHRLPIPSTPLGKAG